MRRVVIAIAAAALAIGMSTGEARGGETERTWSVAAVGGWGSEFNILRSGNTNAYGWGLGARAGVSLSSRTYLGVAFTHHIGATVSARGEGSQLLDRRNNTLFGGELGYEIPFNTWLLRPYVGLGWRLLTAITTVQGQTNDESKRHVYVAPGIIAAVSMRPLLFGIDVRMIAPPSEPAANWALAALGLAALTF